MGKLENAGNQHFLSFKKSFQPLQKHISHFFNIIYFSYQLQMLSILLSLKSCCLVIA